MVSEPRRTRNDAIDATTGTATVFLRFLFAPGHDVVLQRYGLPSKLSSKQMIYVKVGVRSRKQE